MKRKPAYLEQHETRAVPPPPRAMRGEGYCDDMYGSAEDQEWMSTADASRMMGDAQPRASAGPPRGARGERGTDEEEEEEWWYISPTDLRESGLVPEDADFAGVRVDPPAEAVNHLPDVLKPRVSAAAALLEDPEPSGAGNTPGGGLASTLGRARPFSFSYMPGDGDNEGGGPDDVGSAWRTAATYHDGTAPTAKSIDVGAAIMAHPMGIYLTTMAAALDVNVMSLINENVAREWAALTDTALDEGTHEARDAAEERVARLETRLGTSLARIRGNAAAFGQMRKRNALMSEARRLVRSFNDAMSPWNHASIMFVLPWLDTWYEVALALRGRDGNAMIIADPAQLVDLIRPIFTHPDRIWIARQLAQLKDIVQDDNATPAEKDEARTAIFGAAALVLYIFNPVEVYASYVADGDGQPNDRVEHDRNTAPNSDTVRNRMIDPDAALTYDFTAVAEGMNWSPAWTGNPSMISMMYLLRAASPQGSWRNRVETFISNTRAFLRDQTSSLGQKLTDTLATLRTARQKLSQHAMFVSDLEKKADQFIRAHRLWKNSRFIQRAFGQAVVFPSDEARLETEEARQEDADLRRTSPWTQRYPHMTELRGWLEGVTRVQDQFVDRMTEDVARLDSLQAALASARVDLRALRLRAIEMRRHMDGWELPEVLPLSTRALGNTITALTKLRQIDGFQSIEPGKLDDAYTKVVLTDSRTAVPLANLAAALVPKAQKRGVRGYTPKNTHNIAIYDMCEAIRQLSQYKMSGVNIHAF